MHDELEWQTRRDRINKKLRALRPAWNIIKFREGLDASALDCHAVEEYPTGNGPADYAFFVKGKLLGIIEAKRVKVGPQNVWIFDARSNVPGITKKERPLTPKHFEEFEACYGSEPNGQSKRKDSGEEGRFRKFHISEIKDRNYKLDIT
ncbi:MAG: N-6 DNA methylase [Thermodesulfobacteriota bacterium]|nr:N-6 DNA methylase [Thermodesulfobacteriota bacterium]